MGHLFEWHHRPMTPHPPSHDCILVACLCARWCLVCGDYHNLFWQVQSELPSPLVFVNGQQTGAQPLQFLWVDVEDEADLLHPIEVEDFPTLLVAVGSDPRFFGPVPPRADALKRMVRSLTQNPTAPGIDQPDVTALVARLRVAHPAVNTAG